MTTDPLADALAELREQMSSDFYQGIGGFHDAGWDKAVDTILNAALSGDLMPRSDHLAALAAANEAAATVDWSCGRDVADDGPDYLTDWQRGLVAGQKAYRNALRSLTTADQQAALDRVKREAIVAELQALVRAWSGEGELDEASTRIALRIAALADGEPT